MQVVIEEKGKQEISSSSEARSMWRRRGRAGIEAMSLPGVMSRCLPGPHVSACYGRQVLGTDDSVYSSILGRFMVESAGGQLCTKQVLGSQHKLTPCSGLLPRRPRLLPWHRCIGAVGPSISCRRGGGSQVRPDFHGRLFPEAWHQKPYSYSRYTCLITWVLLH